MRHLYVTTHADVEIDPDVPVPDWRLNARGRRRHAAFAARVQGLGAVCSSYERKAMEGADIVAGVHGLVAQRVIALHENDRSATGYLPEAAFQRVVDRFFAEPRQSVRGWERAIDAQYRVVATLKRVLAEAPKEGPIVVVAHGGIGALFRARLLGAKIDRSHDQPGRHGGNFLTVGLPDWTLEGDWTPIEAA